MDLTLLTMCSFPLLGEKCSSDATIQQCPYGQQYVAEYGDVSLTCGPCSGLINWYVDDNSGEPRKFVGGCIKTICIFDRSGHFRLKVNTRNPLSFKSVLDILHFTRNNTRFVCECFHNLYRKYPPRNDYHLQSRDSCKLLVRVPPGSPQLQCPETVLEGSNVICTCTSANKGSPPAQFVWDGTNTDTLLLRDVRREINAMKYTCRQTWGRNGLINRTVVYTVRVIENKQPPSENNKGRVVGGVFAAVVAFIIFGTTVTVYIVKRRKVANRSQTPAIHYVASSGDIYTIANTATFGDVHGEYVTASEITDNTASETDVDDNFQTSKEVPNKTEMWTTLKDQIKSKPATERPRNHSDSSGSGCGNVPEMPTDSGLGVYHIVPWAVIPAPPQPETGENYEAALPEEEYNVLKFGENRTEQEDQGDTYHHLVHN